MNYIEKYLMINVSYILNLIRNVDLTNEEQKQKDIADIEAKLINITDDELFLKADLIRSFLTSILPALKANDSIDEAFDNHLIIERKKEIEKFAKDNELDKKLLNKIIDEYDYSGIYPSQMLSDATPLPFLKKVSMIDKIKEFMSKLKVKYM